MDFVSYMWLRYFGVNCIIFVMCLYCNRIELSQNLAVITGVDGKELSSYLVYNQGNYV